MGCFPFSRALGSSGDSFEALGARGSFERSQLLLRCRRGAGFPGEFGKSEQSLEFNAQKTAFAGTLRNSL
jgi:hypothetical protein